MIGIVKCLDKRNAYIFQELGDKVAVYSDNINDFYDIDIIIGPLNGFDKDLYFKGTNLPLKQIHKQNPHLKRVMTGLVTSELISYAVANNIELVSLLENEKIKQQNAFFTSEALIRYIDKTDVSLKDKRIAILGFGYITHYLVQILGGFENTPSVYTKNILEQKFVKLKGLHLIENVLDIKNYDVIINTIPENIVSESDYQFIDKPIYDLASYPYGFNPIIAKENGLFITYLPGLPGAELPYSSAKILMIEIKKHLYGKDQVA